MKVLVVGGAGYVGCVLVPTLVREGFDVRVFDRMFFGDQGLDSVKDDIEIIVGDQRVLPDNLLDGIDAVIALGGLSNDPTADYNPQANYEMNTLATINLARECKKKGVRRFVFASSCSVYDTGVGNDRVSSEIDFVRPTSPYSDSKYRAEKGLLGLGTDIYFEPVILRKGTIFGFSPRMRYDLVVNTFVKDAISNGKITLHNGGEMWRPLVEIRDVAAAYIACLRATPDQVAGKIFNVSFGNFRISEVALRVCEALSHFKILVEIVAEYQPVRVRNYCCSNDLIRETIGFDPFIRINRSVNDMVNKIYQSEDYSAFDNPRFYNIKWMKLLEEAADIVAVTGSVFGI